MELVAYLGDDAENRGQVIGLIKKGDWEKVLVLGSDFGLLSDMKNIETIKTDDSLRLMDLRDEMLKKIRGRIQGTEVALSIASGGGKEHMALISALLSIPVGIRFYALTKEGIVQF